MEHRLNARKLSDSIAAELEQRILEGSWKAGDRLPAERELSTQLGVSRASLREGLQKLVSRGLLSSRQGGGTYVTDRLDAGFLEPWEGLLRKHASVREDLLEFRELLEAKAAACAAERATAEDKARLQRCFDTLDQAYRDGALEVVAAADLAFHQAVAEAAHNAIIGHLTASLLRLLQDSLQLNLAELMQAPQARELLRRQHQSIFESIMQGDQAAAGRQAAKHVDYVRDTLAESLKRESRRESAQRRLEVGK
ncbi:MAG: GntR family transcriptional regulator transcriptional repressor for pyruvate dehydrogenase complex [Rhodocyclaceae bacterium]|nr:MAG: GntR family transcriptional regulator transcriptional repressor for pyruvate dehydrogenase complex [Rhodocyclaceae bacterium]TND01895.1 MAG: GntR family transcriptional regulator, transcriptional repressor for pyruvate dehydrogenase complex [Rhodocyclaceae bacterium]